MLKVYSEVIILTSQTGLDMDTIKYTNSFETFLHSKDFSPQSSYFLVMKQHNILAKVSGDRPHTI